MQTNSGVDLLSKRETDDGKRRLSEWLSAEVWLPGPLGLILIQTALVWPYDLGQVRRTAGRYPLFFFFF